MYAFEENVVAYSRANCRPSGSCRCKHNRPLLINITWTLLPQDVTLGPGPEPPDFSDQLITLIPPVLWDGAPWGKEFGDCVAQPQKQYSYGDVVTASFVSIY